MAAKYYACMCLIVGPSKPICRLINLLCYFLAGSDSDSPSASGSDAEHLP